MTMEMNAENKKKGDRKTIGDVFEKCRVGRVE